MVSRRRNINDDVKRRRPTREPKRRILIVCEGRETEPSYFQALKQTVRNRLVHVEIAKETGVPYTVVSSAVAYRFAAEEEAKRQHDQNLLWNEVWAVFDVDEHPNLAEARDLAMNKGIRAAISNPCFELWALLHVQDQRAHIERHKARAGLQTHLSDYDKCLTETHFAKLYPGYEDALRRA